MTRPELRAAREQVIRKYHVALEDDWEKALPRLMAELDALDPPAAAKDAPEGHAEAAKPATTSRRARK